MRNRKNQGFTLIELLIVIAIIGILAAVLIPNLLGARSRAVETGAQAYARNCATAVAAYAIDNAGASLAGLDCETTLATGAKPDYVTAAATTSTGDAVSYTYNLNGTSTTASIPVNF